MRRTQLYLDDQLWNALHARARHENTTISELVRRAARDRYLSSQQQRTEAMQRFVGIASSAPSAPDSTEQVRALRRSSRLLRLGQQ